MEFGGICDDQLPHLDLQVLDQPVLLVQILVQAVDFPCREDVRADQAGEEQEKKKAAERKSKSWHGGDRMVVDGFILPQAGHGPPVVLTNPHAQDERLFLQPGAGIVKNPSVAQEVGVNGQEVLAVVIIG